MRIAITLSLLCSGLLAGSAAADDRPAVLAYYYPWYVRGDWSRHDYTGTPVLGKYGTDSAETARQHVDWCADHGIDGLFVSWWGAGQLTDRHLRSGLLEAPNLGRIRFAVFYESTGRLDAEDGKRDVSVDFGHPNVMAKLIRDFQYLAENYLKHPQYLTVDGRPVVGLYLTRTFRGCRKEHIDRLREAVGVDLYLVADEVFFGRQDDPATARHGKGIFDAYTAYNMLQNQRVRKGDTAATYHVREAFPIYRKWAEEVTLIPGFFPSYADFRGNKKLPGSRSGFAELLDAASTIAESNRPGAPRMILITSFNEWWEGTTIEPAKEYGTDYLEAIREFKAGRK